MSEQSRIKSQAKRLAMRAIQARLVEQDSNFRQFALDKGFEPRTVTQVVARYAGQDDLPRGRLSFRILLELSRATGLEVVPGILKAAAADAA
ncbi:MAG: hypothetical protein COW58_14385 [Thalassolituus sp. CG17_big_fil_post_rev_8_21_14_2_50_53_8]|jgi:hypothetical protein|nr:MAG: hypothetical protein COW58_14385 [Thalassolituus sp. CG17_big_fil_post_rev_8_21_14_2_50_53_8]